MGLSYQGTTVYCPPAMADKLTYTGNGYITAQQVQDLENYFKTKNTGVGLTTAVILGGVFGVLGGSLSTAIGGATSMQMAVGNLSKYFNSTGSSLFRDFNINAAIGGILAYPIGEFFNKTLTSNVNYDNAKKNGITISYTYRYVRHGSNDGAYFVDNCSAY